MEAYVALAMKSGLFLSTALVLCATGVAQAEDILDTKLNELKKRVRRSAYSSPAVLNDQNLTVPRTVTEQERALDRKIRQMEKEGDAAPGLISRQMPTTRPVARPQKEPPANWLTPELLDDLSGEDDAGGTDDESWIFEELARQEELKKDLLTEQEQERVIQQRLNQPFAQDDSSTRTPLQNYDADLQRIISAGSTKPSSTPSYLKDPRSIYKRIEEPSGTSQEAEPERTSVFSTLRPRRSTQPVQRPFSTSRSYEPGSTSEAPSARSSSQSPSWERQEEPARKRVRQKSPLYEENPFE